MPDVTRIMANLRAFATSGTYPGGLDSMQADLMSIIGTPEGDEAMKLLESLGATEGGNKTLNIEDYYVPGNTLFELKWPLGVQLPIAFDQLDHKTQFFVLFGEWTRREMEASYILGNGDPMGAKAAYEECMERAKQIGVNELVARSHEGLARVAGTLNDRAAERRHLQDALAARG